MLGILVAIAGVLVARVWWIPSSEPAPEPRALPPTVSGLGRLAPESNVIGVAPPTMTGAMAGARVERLMVDVGDIVQAGQVVAVLDTQRGRAAGIRQLRAQVAVAQAHLALVKAGPKAEDVSAQEAAIRRATADLADAEAHLARARQLLEKGVVSREDFEGRQLRYNQAGASLQQEQSRLAAMKAIRPEDVLGAEAELARAEASLAIGEEDMRNTEVRSPIAGRVLRIHTQAGERVGDAGLLDVGDTRVMNVVAEVYEGDIAKVRIGQPARVRVPTLGEMWLAGEVVGRDLVVARQDLFGNDPVADVDSRIVEVRIRLSAADGPRVAGLSNARADVVIDVSGTDAS